MFDEFYKIKEEVMQNIDNPEKLSTLLIVLTGYLFNHTILLANADLTENQAIKGYLDSKTEDGKKFSVAEAEVRAKVDTGNAYKTLSVTKDAVVEMLNTIKKRLEILSWEYKKS